MTRNLILNEKAKAVQKDLERWAAKNAILQPGEHIVFSMHIESSPTVVRINADLSALTVPEFFTVQRFVESGIPAGSIVSRCIRQIAFDARRLEHDGYHYETMGEFLERTPTFTRLLGVQNIGRRSACAIAVVLKAANLPFDAQGYA